MALSLHEFEPINDALDCGCSLIEEDLGRNYHVEDKRCRGLTTHRNHRLLRYARQIAGTGNCRAVHLHRDDFSRLGDGQASSPRRAIGGLDAAMPWLRGSTAGLIPSNRRAL